MLRQDEFTASNLQIEELKYMIKEREESIKRKEKKLELLKKAEGGEALKAAEARLRRVGSESRKEREEAAEAIKQTLNASGVPLTFKKEELLREIDEVEKAHEEQESRMHTLEEDLRTATETYSRLKREKKELCYGVMEIIQDLKEILNERKEAASQFDQQGVSNTPYALLQSIAELTKDREAEVSNNERQLREICQIISMKKQREQELQTETDEKIRKAVQQKDGEELELINQCAREKQDISDRIKRLESENEHYRAQLHWKHQKTLRDMKDRKIDRSGKRAIRDQIVVPTGGKKKKKATDKDKEEEEEKEKEKEEDQQTESRGLSPTPTPRGPRDMSYNQKKDGRDDEKFKIRKMEGEIAKVQTDFMKTKRELEYKVSYERGQAEQFERENQKMEAQAEHLAQTLQMLKAEIKRKNAAIREQAATPRGAMTPRGMTPRSPRPMSARR
eukprot:TRINITY_DN27209_c2_g1_i2.p1 TRINITY_DN27209_c2_g1~~TRINITY_DN27209_c2_g1_i2.p1  ORF type:complete len:449 (+),score=224.31 TRINITY_DN27209_c2_g1_i2:105-1451(+)